MGDTLKELNEEVYTAGIEARRTRQPSAKAKAGETATRFRGATRRRRRARELRPARRQLDGRPARRCGPWRPPWICESGQASCELADVGSALGPPRGCRTKKRATSPSASSSDSRRGVLRRSTDARVQVVATRFTSATEASGLRRIPGTPCLACYSIRDGSRACSSLLLIALLLPAARRAAAALAVAPPADPHRRPSRVIVTPDEVATEPELAARGERALMEQRWQDAADAYRTLVAADATPAHLRVPLRPGARARGHADRERGARHVPRSGAALPRRAQGARGARPRGEPRRVPRGLEGPRRRSATRCCARSDLEDVDRIVALGSRGLARVELGEDGRASKDIFDGLELADSSTTARATCCRWRSRSCASRSASCGACVPSASLRPAAARLRRRSSRSAAAACSRRRRPTRWRCARSTRTGRRCRATASARCTARCTATSCRFRRPRRRRPSSRSRCSSPSCTSATACCSRRACASSSRRWRSASAQPTPRPGSSARARPRRRCETALEDEKAQIARMPFTEAEVNAALDLLKKKTVATGAH